jgi:calcium uptake protein 1, mitochondrial
MERLATGVLSLSYYLIYLQIIWLEFSHYDVKSSKTIPAKDFALSMVASANMNHINKFLDRVDDLVNEPILKDIRITFQVWFVALLIPWIFCTEFISSALKDISLQLQEFKSFADLRRRLEPLSMAIFSYGKVNGFLTKQDLKRAAYHVRFRTCLTVYEYLIAPWK